MNHVCIRSASEECGDIFNFMHRWYFTIGNDVGALFTVKIWLTNYFDMKDLGEANYILGIKLLWDHRNKMLSLSQTVYIDKILVGYIEIQI